MKNGAEKPAGRKKAAPMTADVAEKAKFLSELGFDLRTIGEKLGGYSESTMVKLAAAGFSLDEYLAQKKKENAEAQRKKRAAMAAEEEEAGQVAGQIEMDLTTQKAEPEKNEMSEMTKMMRFQAAQVDKLIMKLDQIYNMASMILRAVRKE